MENHEVLSEQALQDGLRAFGFDSFRPGQREAIETLFKARRLLLVAPTGGGKSLAYQLPGSLLSGTTLVISPLIALMTDQVRALSDRGIPATYLASTLGGDEMRDRMRRMAAGEFKLVYVAPERLSFGGFRSLLTDIDCPLVAIDEAHCIAEWGHDFRPEYLQIGEVVARMTSSLVLACTATATPVVRDEILARLDLGPDTPQLVQGFARPNLSLRAIEIDKLADGRHRIDALLAEALGAPDQATGTAIVYAATRKHAQRESERLADQGWRADYYHAGRTGPERDRVHRRFSHGKLDVVVATNAFGMGIDRADVRAVIHLSPPSSIEAYYQEVGRAGRDGEPAYGLLLASQQDYALRRRLFQLPVDGREPAPEVVEHKWQQFLELMRWVEGGSCRHDAILRYFADDAETVGGCGRCDNCLSIAAAPEFEGEEAVMLVRKALSGVARIHGNFGLMKAARLLAGKSDEAMRRGGLEAVSTFGVLSQHDVSWLVRLLRRCVTAGWVTFSGDERPVIRLTTEGVEAMRGERPIALLLPTRAAPVVAGTGRGLVRPARTAPTEGLDPRAALLFEALRAHRLTLARDQGVPPYMIASDRSLRDLAVLRPKRLSDLLMAHGIGKGKVEKYGQGLLDVVAEQADA